MNSRVILKKFRSSFFIFVFVALLLTTLINLYVLEYGISYREVIVTLVGVAGLIVLAAGDQGLKVGLVFLVVTFGLGYRTLHLTPSLSVHPSEFVLWGLLVLPLVQPENWRRGKKRIWLPFWLVLFIPFWIWAWFQGLAAGFRWDEMFNEFRNFVLLVPLFIVAEMVLTNRTNWRHILLTFFCIGTWIAGMGVLEYLFPGVKSVFSAFITAPEPHESPEGFARAIFSFWGSPAATFILVLSAPMATILWHWWPIPWQRGLIFLALVFQVCGIYIGGYRSMWMVFTVQLLVFAILYRKVVVAAVSLLFPILGTLMLPTSAQERALSGVYLVTGSPQHTDTSGIKRWGRMTTAFADTLNQPMGHGWAASGWVHNDFIQVAANLGVLAGLLFAGAFLFTLCRILRRVLVPCVEDDLQLGLALLISFIGAGALLGLEGVEVLTQLVLPVWFVWVLVEIWLRQKPRARRVFNVTPAYISTSTDL
jgi:hypothetical protein